MRFKATLTEFIKRVISYDKKLEIFSNGINNDYPEKIERLINNSVTAKQSSGTMTSFLTGKGFGETNNKIKVDGEKTLFSFLSSGGKSIARQRGIFIHVNYDQNFEFTSLKVLPFSHCRIGKKDDNSYNGKILVCSDWSDEKLAKKAESIDVYNRKEKVIQAQFDANGEDYKGQILFVNLDEETDYPYATIDAVQNDCDSESQASIYKNRSLRKGFFGKTLVVTRPMIGVEKTDANMEKWTAQDSERKQFQKTIKNFIGAENSDGVLHLEMEFDEDENLDKAILFKNIEANIDDKLFQFTEDSVANNICFAFNNIPKILVRNTEAGSIFGSNGTAIFEAKLFYQDQTTIERTILINTVIDLMSNFKGHKETILTHELLVQKKEAVI